MSSPSSSSAVSFSDALNRVKGAAETEKAREGDRPRVDDCAAVSAAQYTGGGGRWWSCESPGLSIWLQGSLQWCCAWDVTRQVRALSIFRCRRSAWERLAADACKMKVGSRTFCTSYFPPFRPSILSILPAPAAAAPTPPYCFALLSSPPPLLCLGSGRTFCVARVVPGVYAFSTIFKLL